MLILFLVIFIICLLVLAFLANSWYVVIIKPKRMASRDTTVSPTATSAPTQPLVPETKIRTQYKEPLGI
jgi:hypothetical protein